MAKKNIFLDMDGALTKGGGKCSKEMRRAVMGLARRHRVIVISSEDYRTMKARLGFIPSMSIWVLADNGNSASKGWRDMWNRKLNAVHRAVISEHIRMMKHAFGETVKDENDLVKDTGTKVVYAMLGHSAAEEEKAAYDPDGSKRLELLEKIPLGSSIAQVGVHDKDTLEYTASNWDKAGNINYLMSIMRWDAEDSIYIGDDMKVGKLFPARHFFYNTAAATLDIINSIT